MAFHRDEFGSIGTEVEGEEVSAVVLAGWQGPGPGEDLGGFFAAARVARVEDNGDDSGRGELGQELIEGDEGGFRLGDEGVVAAREVAEVEDDGIQGWSVCPGQAVRDRLMTAEMTVQIGFGVRQRFPPSSGCLHGFGLDVAGVHQAPRAQVDRQKFGVPTPAGGGIQGAAAGFQAGLEEFMGSQNGERHRSGSEAGRI